MCCSGGPTSIRNQNFRLVPFLASATSRSSSTPETPLHTHNYLPTHRASGSLQTALSKVLRNQASAQSNFICRNTSDRELALSRPELSEQGQNDSDKSRKTTIQQDCW